MDFREDVEVRWKAQTRQQSRLVDGRGFRASLSEASCLTDASTKTEFTYLLTPSLANTVQSCWRMLEAAGVRL